MHHGIIALMIGGTDRQGKSAVPRALFATLSSNIDSTPKKHPKHDPAKRPIFFPTFCPNLGIICFWPRPTIRKNEVFQISSCDISFDRKFDSDSESH